MRSWAPSAIAAAFLIAQAAAAVQQITPVPAGPFHVQGARILDSRGRPFLLRGTQLAPFHLETEAHESRSATDFGAHSATSLAAIRLLFNMNAVRLPLDPGESGRPGYFEELRKLVRRAHEFELLVVLAPNGPAAEVFWSRCAAAFRDDPNVMFDLSTDARASLVRAIRQAGAEQPVLAHASALDDSNVIYETSHGESDELASRVPVYLNGWDLPLNDPAACASLPSDPAVVSRMVGEHLDALDRLDISWTISEFGPGKLIKDFSLHAATTLEDGWTCGSGRNPDHGLGRLVEGHLRGTDERSLFVVSDAGGIDLPRGAFAIAYGPVMAERDSPATGKVLPRKLAGVRARVTDSEGASRSAEILWVSAGWGQMNFVIPDQSCPGPGLLTLIRDDGSRLSSPILIADTAPGFRAGLSLRGPALGALQPSGNPIWKCEGVDCRSLPIPVRREGSVQVRLVGTGFRHASSPREIQVTIAGVGVPVVSFGADSSPGMDQVTVAIPPILRGRGEADVIAHVRGRVSNVVRVLLASAETPAPFDWRLPEGFRAPRVPADNPMSDAKVSLGRYLFYDKRLSANGTQSCATCHRQELAFTDGRATSLGSTGQQHPRSAMSLVNVAYNATLTWANPAMHSLEQQALVPMFSDHPVELGLRGRENDVIAMLRADHVYRDLFPQAFPGPAPAVTIGNVTRALAAFERTIISARSPYDRFHVSGDPSAISESAKRGETVFFSDPVAGCFRCHSGVNFTDGLYHNTALYSPYPASNPGVNGGKFKTPSLRNVAVTAPYMHDGSIGTLEEVLDHYSAGGRAHQNPGRDPLMHKFQFTPQNRIDLLAFLRSLTDEDLLHDPRFSNPW